jgi:hypothetical protein
MKILRSIILFILFISISCAKKVDCTKYTEDTIPKNLNESLECLECFTKEDFKLEFKSKKESDAVSSLHFGFGKLASLGW